MDAAGWWRKLAVQDPYSTRIALGLMEALADAGDWAGALRYAEIHTALLREEFGSEPDSALTDLEKRLRSDAPSPVPQTPHRQERSHLSQPEAVATLPSAPEKEASESPSESRDGLSQASEPSGPTDPKALFAGAVRRIGKQKMVQWGITYLAGAWFVIQFMDAFAEAWGIPLGFQRGAFVVLFFGFLLTLVLVWYHGEEGRQRVSGPELLIIAALLVIAGGVLTVAGPGRDPSHPAAGLPGPGDPEGRPTIAVLPFENFSPDPEDAYFANGMHEEIISKFSKISALRVISRSSLNQENQTRRGGYLWMSTLDTTPSEKPLFTSPWRTQNAPWNYWKRDTAMGLPSSGKSTWSLNGTRSGPILDSLRCFEGWVSQVRPGGVRMVAPERRFWTCTASLLRREIRSLSPFSVSGKPRSSV